MTNVEVQTTDEPSVATDTTVATTPAVPTVTKQKPRFSKHYAVEGLLFVTVIALALFAWNLSGDNDNLSKELAAVKANPQAVVQQQTDSLIAKVGKLIDLPADETPTIAAVTDVAAAKKQSSFFANAQNGDKVLLYVKAGKAILYRPGTNKIIESQPLTINNNTAAATSTTGTTTKQ